MTFTKRNNNGLDSKRKKKEWTRFQIKNND